MKKNNIFAPINSKRLEFVSDIMINEEFKQDERILLRITDYNN